MNVAAAKEKAEQVRQFVREMLPALCREETSDASGYALPPASLALLLECVKRLGVRRVFEFGTGQSTRIFLEAGCEVTAVEDGADWLAETQATLDAQSRGRFTAFSLPLRRVWHRGVPMRSWVLPDVALAALRDAELVLVDSPALPPFREHALTLALAHARNALVVVDDANIPTVARFCRRLAERNDAAFFQTRMDHGLFFFAPIARPLLDDARPVLENLKAWRRYFHPRAGA